jgi:hypothetical protein
MNEYVVIAPGGVFLREVLIAGYGRQIEPRRKSVSLPVGRKLAVGAPDARVDSSSSQSLHAGRAEEMQPDLWPQVD